LYVNRIRARNFGRFSMPMFLYYDDIQPVRRAVRMKRAISHPRAGVVARRAGQRRLPMSARKYTVNDEKPIDIQQLARRLKISVIDAYQVLAECAICGDNALYGHVFQVKLDSIVAICPVCLTLITEVATKHVRKVRK
jgi:hypothetical protein